MKKIICILLALILLTSMIPVLAEEDSDEGDDSIVVPVEGTENIDPDQEEPDEIESETSLVEEDLTGDGTETEPAQPAGTPAPTEAPLRYGSKGNEVKKLQKRLVELGYYKGRISGNYLDGTRNGITAFQEKNGLPVTGEADAETQALLFSSSALGKADVPENTPTPIPELNGYLVQEDHNIVMPDEPVPFTKTLKRDSSGKLVKQMQERLQQLGYYEGPISGNFQKYTYRAVKALQEQNGLEGTGIVDEVTWNLIFNDPGLVLPQDTPKPTPSPSPVPFAITVDVQNQVTTVYGRDENGEYTVVVRQMLCSTGLKATPSDVGDWVLNGRKATWCTFPKWGNSYARYWTRINSSIAFHSVLYTAVSNTALKVVSYKKLGQRASHGCIRLTVADAKWIYDNVGAGTVVSIVEGLPSQPELRDALKLPPLNTKSMTPAKTPEPTAEPEYRSDVKPDLGGKTLKMRSESEAVFWMQNRLKELGYYHTKCTGKMLDCTVNALKQFQRDHGLHPNGVATQKDIDALFEAEIPTPTPAPTETPEPIPEP